MTIHLADMTASALGIKDLSVETEDSATNSITIISDAIKNVSTTRSRFGAYQNRLEHAKKINDNTSENLQYAESIIRDTDMAKEMVAYSNHKILSQAGQSMLSQANQQKEYLVNLISA